MMSSSPKQQQQKQQPLSATDCLSKHTADAKAALSTIMHKELTYYACQGYPFNPSDPSIITPTDRENIVNWCYGLIDHCQCHSPETVTMAMEMVDRFISVSVGPAALWDAESDTAKAGEKAMRSRRVFQLLALAALCTSIKRVHGIPPSDLLTDIMSYCGVYSKEDIETMECTLLKGLSWRYNTHTPYQVGYSILALIVPHVNLPEDAWCFLLDEIKHQTEYAVRDYYFSTQRPSTIALAAIFNAVECITRHDQNAVGAYVRRIVEAYEFDQESIITMSRNRLTSNSVKKMMPLQPVPLKPIGMMMPHQSNPNKSVRMMISCLHSNVSTKLMTPRPSAANRAISPDAVKMRAATATTGAATEYSLPRSVSRDDDQAVSAIRAMQMSRASPFKRDPYSIRKMGNVADSIPISDNFFRCNGTAAKANSASDTTVSTDNTPTKPKRPLTSYHIYFQLEREYIVQTMEGEEADKSMHDNKVYLDYVPDRYKQIKLSPEWYFAPGKRKRRKHRKKHGKIGFLELSGMISARWKKLGETNPEIKEFVQKIAAQERDVYLREKEEYKHLTKDMSMTSQAEASSPLPIDCKKVAKRTLDDEPLPSNKKLRLVTPRSSKSDVFSKTATGGGDAEDWHEFVQKMETIFEEEHTAELNDLFGTSLPAPCTSV